MDVRKVRLGLPIKKAPLEFRRALGRIAITERLFAFGFQCEGFGALGQPGVGGDFSRFL